MPSPATLTATAGFPPATVYATQAGKISASASRTAGATATATGTAAVSTSVS